ncbi:MAG: hypothetical protein NTX50_09385 [Candidatus Sumerlaeota bacterium]|nr:hypothetical protein [Candidatus Sumerlaeota bacterium]
MKTIAISARSNAVNQLLKQALTENLILRSCDGREFILAEVDDFDREIELTRKNKKLMAFLDRCGRHTKTFSLEEAKIRLGISAKGRKSVHSKLSQPSLLRQA